jgi:hypothetical protein
MLPEFTGIEDVCMGRRTVSFDENAEWQFVADGVKWAKVLPWCLGVKPSF